jgi:hypothetical protein
MWHSLTDEGSRVGFAVAERYADGFAKVEEVLQIQARLSCHAIVTLAIRHIKEGGVARTNINEVEHG